MPETEGYRKGSEMRRKLLGDAFVERTNSTTYKDPVMRKFIDVATETVFGALWTRPGLDLKTRTLVCVVSDAATGREPELHSSPHGSPSGMDGRGTDGDAPAHVRLRGRADHSRVPAHGLARVQRGQSRALMDASESEQARRERRERTKRMRRVIGLPLTAVVAIGAWFLVNPQIAVFLLVFGLIASLAESRASGHSGGGMDDLGGDHGGDHGGNGGGGDG